MSRLLDERGQPVRFQLHPALLVAQRMNGHPAPPGWRTFVALELDSKRSAAADRVRREQIAREEHERDELEKALRCNRCRRILTGPDELAADGRGGRRPWCKRCEARRRRRYRMAR